MVCLPATCLSLGEGKLASFCITRGEVTYDYAMAEPAGLMVDYTPWPATADPRLLSALALAAPCNCDHVLVSTLYL